MKLLYAKAVLGLVLILTLLCQDVLQTDAKITKNTSKKGKQTILTTSKTHSNSSHAVKASTSSKKKTNSSSSVPMDQITELSQQEAGVWDAHGHSFGQWVFDETTRQLTYTREITVPQAQGLPDALTLIKSTAVSTITPTTAGQFTATISVPVGGEASETQLMETSSSSSASSSASIEGGSEMKQIGRYVKQKEIGRGSFGKVCLYTDPATQESVVVKFALQELVSKDKRGRALNSAAASAATARVAADMENECNFGIKLLSDWPQCSLFMGCDGFFMDSAATTTASSTATATTAAPSPVPGGSSTGGDFYAVLQAGGEVTLLQAMKNKDLSFEQGMVIIYQMFTAVARMAASGLVHHDLSAANVMLQYKAGGGSSQIEPYVKLVDYGCMYTPATYADGIDSKAEDALPDVITTPAYKAPEGNNLIDLATGMFSKAADARAQRISEVKASIAYPGSYDTYAVGKILVEMMNYVLWKRFDIAPGKIKTLRTEFKEFQKKYHFSRMSMGAGFSGVEGLLKNQCEIQMPDLGFGAQAIALYKDLVTKALTDNPSQRATASSLLEHPFFKAFVHRSWRMKDAAGKNAKIDQAANYATADKVRASVKNFMNGLGLGTSK